MRIRPLVRGTFLAVFGAVLLALVAVVSLVVACALLGGSRALRLLAVAIGIAMVALPWFLPAQAIALRAVVGVSVLWVLARLWELARTPVTMSIGRRLWCVTAPFDASLSEPAKPELSLRRLAGVVFWASLAACGLIVALAAAPQTSGWFRLGLRWLGGLIGFYAGVEAGTRGLELVHGLLGLRIPAIQDQPLRATSVGEFWGRRWNRPVSRWLWRHCFAPLARRGRPSLGVLLSFSASALLHFYFVWVSIGVSMAAVMACFFLVQVPIVLLEKAVLGSIRSGRLARVWTVLVLIGASPLFLEPMLRIIERAV